MHENPWLNIERPIDPGTYKIRRVDPNHSFDFYWGKDPRGRSLFLMVFGNTSRPNNQRLPILKGLEVDEFILAEEEKHQLVLALKDHSNIDLFYSLCCDLLDGTRSCPDERTAVTTTLSRLWRWQRLMQQGRTDKLSETEQKGLIGELSFIKDTLFTHFTHAEAVSFWQGPMSGEGEKDFSLGETAVEIKTRSASARALVRISSERQLDTASYRNLLIVVFEVNTASSVQDVSFCLQDIVAQIRRELEEEETPAQSMFEEKLASYGYSDLHDYTSDRFVLLGISYFRVEGTFPRLICSDIPAGIHNVTYSLDLAACRDFELDNETFLQALGAAT